MLYARKRQQDSGFNSVCVYHGEVEDRSVMLPVTTWVNYLWVGFSEPLIEGNQVLKANPGPSDKGGSTNSHAPRPESSSKDVVKIVKAVTLARLSGCQVVMLSCCQGDGRGSRRSRVDVTGRCVNSEKCRGNWIPRRNKRLMWRTKHTRGNGRTKLQSKDGQRDMRYFMLLRVGPRLSIQEQQPRYVVMLQQTADHQMVKRANRRTTIRITIIILDGTMHAVRNA